jgi:hypothetical protein
MNANSVHIEHTVDANGSSPPAPLTVSGEPHLNEHATNGHADATNGHTVNGHTVNGNSVNGNSVNGKTGSGNTADGAKATPIAICGMACRLPGGIHSPKELWDFLLAKGDARTRVPDSRYNIAAYHSPTHKPGTTVADFGYFLDESVALGGLDSSFFSISRQEVERLDPQQRLLLEVAREALDDSGEVGWRGTNIGVYVGNYGQDWYDLFNREPQMFGHQVTATNDFMISNRLSYEMDLHGPRYDLIHSSIYHVHTYGLSRII